MTVGFSRPLQKEDLWQLPPDRLTGNLSDEVERAFYDRCAPEQRPAFLRERSPPEHGEVVKDSASSTTEAPGDEKQAFAEKRDAKLEGNVAPEAPSHTGNNQDTAPGPVNKKKYDGSLLKALHKTFFWRWWSAGILTLIANTLTTTSPLVNKLFLTWLTASYTWSHMSAEERKLSGESAPKGIGYGIGLAFALFIMQEASSVIASHYSLMTMTTGLQVRTSVIGCIFRKSLRLSGRARMDHSVGQITTMISTDAMRLERVTAYAHILWVAPIQIAIGIGLLIGQLGYSALVGLAVLAVGFPLQSLFVRTMFRQRKQGVVVTDQRVRLVTEVLQGIRLIKYYVWESFYANQVWSVRKRELNHIRRLGIARASLISLVAVVPVLAAILSFITYALSGHDLNVAVIFTALQFFNILTTPLRNFPLVFSVSSDAYVALGRISKFLVADELAEPYRIEPTSEHAIDVEGDFSWEIVKKPEAGKFGRGGRGRASGVKEGAKDQKKDGSDKKLTGLFTRRKGNEDTVLPMTAVGDKNVDPDKTSDEKPFALNNLSLKVPKGSFVVIVGGIGCGKSSLLQALIGEMRRVRGSTVFSSSVAYVPQSAWIMNATLRENITFGQPDNEKKFQAIVDACCLQSDLEMLPNGQDTEIGEKGINLSGGQKARVSLARAAYSGADIVLMDDSLSAVDAHVGKAILDNCLLSGPLAGKTRVLVTHALHVLDKADYIYVMDNGLIVEQGTYSDLMSSGATFSRLMEDYGNLEKKEKEVTTVARADEAAVEPAKADAKDARPLMQKEERNTGAVTLKTYARYFRYAGGLFWIAVIILELILYQGASVANNLFLGFWTSESISGFTQGGYMGTYAALGVASAVFSFSLSLCLTLSTLFAGSRMFFDALNAVLHSPVSFFDTTPMGRVMSRLSSDQDTLDTNVSMIAYQLLSTFSSVIGTVALVFYTFPYLGIIFIPLLIFYYVAALFYRRTSVETKRLDSIMRSALYAAYSESLTGLSTVRAYAAQRRFVTKSEFGLDMENRAYYMTIAIQQWLALRLNTLGNILVLGIALFAAGFRLSVSPSRIGVVLSYTLNVTSIFSTLVQTYAQNEQNFNAVERVLHYTELPSEGERETPNDPSPSWPEKGQIDFKGVELAYREGLPLVLKGVSFTIQPGEKVGIVGRTGAGKSSLLQALFRIVNVSGGAIEIDGYNTHNIGLDTLRGGLALVPQDALLFKGTLRENLDPQATRTDAELISALQRVWLLPRDGSQDSVAEAKFSLDAAVSDEGSNYSAGEKQLLALCRAIVKNSRVIVLDEATSNVDVEMDAKLQKTIQTEFASSTLMCIAHRLNTVVYYDKIIVMEAGKVAEFDTPMNLFDQTNSIFRSLCEEAGLSRQDIVRIRASVSAMFT